MYRRLLAAAVGLVVGAAFILTGTAGAEASFSGWTNGCFTSGCTPGTSSSFQVDQALGMAYINATFAGSTADGTFALGGDANAPNTDNFGSFMLAAFDGSYEGMAFDLRVRVAGQTVAVPAVLHGAVTSAGAGGVVVDFDNTPRSLTRGDGSVLVVTVDDVAVAPGPLVAVSGTVTTPDVAPRAGATVATPLAGAPATSVSGAVDGVAFAGTTAGGVLPISLGSISVPGTAAVHAGESFTATVTLDAPLAFSAGFTGSVSGRVVASGTGAYVLDFPDAPVSVDLPDGGRLTISANDTSIAPGHTAVVTGQIVQSPVNRPPVAANDTYTRRRGNHAPVVVTGVLGNDTDPDGDALTAAVLTGVSKGTLTFQSDGTFTYLPNPNSQDGDSFTYRAYDGKAWSAPATVTIAVESAAGSNGNGPKK